MKLKDLELNQKFVYIMVNNSGDEMSIKDLFSMDISATIFFTADAIKFYGNHEVIAHDESKEDKTTYVVLKGDKYGREKNVC